VCVIFFCSVEVGSVKDDKELERPGVEGLS